MSTTEQDGADVELHPRDRSARDDAPMRYAPHLAQRRHPGVALDPCYRRESGSQPRCHENALVRGARPVLAAREARNVGS
jgi:hypothetical protein